MSEPTSSTPPPSRIPPAEWYKSPDVAARLDQEYQQLAERYQIESALAPDGQMFYRLSPKHRCAMLSFYLAAGPGFPTQAPHVFLLIAGQPHRISAPSLGSWAAHSRMVDLADELVEWLAFSLDDYFAAANRALDHGDHAAAADLLTLVLAVEPRTPGAARLLAKAQAAPC